MKMITTILLIVCCMFLLGSLVYFSGNKPMLEGSLKEMITRVYASKGITISNGGISITPTYDTIYTKDYKVFKKTGNESLYDVTFTKKGKNTTICLEAGWDSKDNYSIPSTLSFYKTNSLSKQADLIKTKASMLSATSFLNPNKFCYQANPEKDFYLKFGENSVIVIQSKNVVTDSLLSNITTEIGDVNMTHLNISPNAPYDNLVGYWNFDGDEVDTLDFRVVDFSKLNNDAGTGGAPNDAHVNSSNCMEGFGNCLQLDGTDDGTNHGVFSEIYDQPGLSMSVWVRTSSLGAFDIITDLAGGVDAVHMYISAGNDDLFYEVWNASNTMGQGRFTNILSLNEWTHVVGVYNGTHVAVYANTVRGSIVGDLKGLTQTTDNVFRIGGTFFDGQIDEVMVFNSSLSQQQIEDIYNNQSARFVEIGTQKVRAVKITDTNTWDNAGNNSVNLSVGFQANLNSNISARIGQINLSVNNTELVLYMPFEWGSAVDISGEGKDGTFNGNAFINESGINDTRGLQLDGTGDYVNMSDFDLGINLSVSFWSRLDVGVGGGNSMDIIYKRAVGSTTLIDYWVLYDETERFNVYIGGASAGDNNAISTTTAILGLWYHIVGVYNGTNTKIYVNGVWEDDANVPLAPDAGLSPMWIGEGFTGSRFMNGAIDEVMVFNRTLTAIEILAIYNNQSGTKNIAYYTEYQNITGNPTNFTINTEADFIFPDFKFHSGDEKFYTPILEGNITLETWNFSAIAAADTSGPSYSNFQDNASSDTTNNTDVQLNVTISDSTAVDFYRIATNNTDGNALTNQSLINATNPLSLTAIFNESIAWFPTTGGTFGWQIWANDTGGFTSTSAIQTFTVQSIGDTCDCSSIQAGTTIDCTENCDVDACDASGNDLLFSGAGNVLISGAITNHGEVGIIESCEVTCRGGCFNTN